jgi:hypothetical protein
MAKLLLATLCDDVREEKTGKVSLMGVFDRFMVADFRAPLPTFWLFAQIGCEREGEHTLTVEFRRIEGDVIFRGDIKHQVNGKNSVTNLFHANINLRLERVTIPGPGAYEFSVHSDGIPVGTLPVDVIQPAPQMLQ